MDVLIVLVPLCLIIVAAITAVVCRSRVFASQTTHSSINSDPLLREELEDTILEEGQVEWDCLVCAHKNHPTVTKCHLCGTPKEGT